MTVEAAPVTGEPNDPIEPVEPEGEPVEPSDETPEPVEDPAEGLKKALRAERLARREAEREARDLKAERDNANKEPAEQALDLARREAAAEATSAANKRILRSEVRAAAKGRLADPSDAFAYLDLDEFEVGEDGDVDSEAIEDAISDLLKRKPYLAADTGEKFRGGADQGARGKGSAPSQLSKEDLKKLTPAQIVQADADGRLNALKGIK